MTDLRLKCQPFGGRPLGLLLLLALLLSLSGCRPAAPDINEVAPGQSRSQVRELAGEPERTRTDELPPGAFFGPQEALSPLLDPGDPYEEWVYVEGDTEFYVWFAGSPDDPASWRVVQTASSPVGAVY